MRAATVIVAAVAAASIMVALAFVLSGGSSGSTTTTTVVKEVEAKAPVEKEGTEAAAGGESGSRNFGGIQECGRELSVEGVSCEVGEEVQGEYEEGHRGSFQPEDPESGERLKFTCGEPNPVICKEPAGSGTVSFGA